MFFSAQQLDGNFTGKVGFIQVEVDIADIRKGKIVPYGILSKTCQGSQETKKEENMSDHYNFFNKQVGRQPFELTPVTPVPKLQATGQ